MLTFESACEAVFKHCPNGYAKTYARAGLGLSSDRERKVQALYILNNMIHWRGPEAKQVREFLKAYAKTLDD